ncbi:MAG: HAMP domain-containing histidine kinase [Thermoproteota archaeon]|nr:HAMP domain-containing histidine kinase [Thermoproteota archaeon]
MQIVDEKTEVLTNPEDIDRVIHQTFSNILHNYSTCIDASGPTVVMSIESMKKRLIVAHTRGVKIRFVTEITTENLPYCKQMMELGEMRHLEGVQGNFGVSETEYLASATLDREKLVPLLIYSNVKQIVKQQQYVFQTLWNKATPAEQRIEEIEHGKEHEFLEVCPDRREATSVYSHFAELVQSEALLILPSSKSLQREYDIGILHKLVDAAAKRKALIRIICPLDNKNAKIAEWLSDKGGPTIQLLDGDGTDSTIFVVDGKLLFRAEYRSDEEEKFTDAVGYAVYSNSKPTVNSFKSFFEMLWNSRLLAEKLKEADRLQREFINIAAHELRTPIQPILGMAELIESTLQEKKDASSIKPEEIEMIARNARRLQKLSEEILDVARIESNSLVLHKSGFNLKDVLTLLIEDCKKQIQMDGREVKILYPQPDDIEVYADKERIMQVLGNLLSNALKFTKHGTITISTEQSNSNDKSHLTVKVIDTGPGIDPALLMRLFTKFVTKSEHGTGLGLYISKSIVEAHGGKIWAENNSDGRGATFTFTLPIQKPHQEHQLRSLS